MSDTPKINWPGWETVNLIGRGSFGAVYEIQRDVFGDVEKAALKVISIPQNDSDIDEMYSDGYDEESITSTFQNHLKSIVTEYSLMRKMNGSANIVNCDDIRYVQHDNGIGWDIFIKMELLTPLAKALPADAPEETVIRVAKDMCAALELCRKHNVVHRDIKPQNIFVSPNGDYKLGDFGIAKTIEKTMGGTKIGTYKYMAPEVYNNQPYGAAADIYSLGLVLYWLLNERRMPFLPLPPAKLTAGAESQAQIRRFSGEPLPPPAHGSDKLKWIVLKACAPNPKDRYSSASDMLRDLNAITDAQIPVYHVEATAPSPRSFVPRPPVPPAQPVAIPNHVSPVVQGFAYPNNPVPVRPTVQNSYVPPVPPVAPVQQKKSNKTTGSLFCIIGAVVTIAVAILLIILLGSGGATANDPVLGVYDGVSCVGLGEELGADGEWIELKARNKATIAILGNEFRGKWALDGETITITIKGVDYVGVLFDNTIVIDFYELLYTFAKDGVFATASTPAENHDPLAWKNNVMMANESLDYDGYCAIFGADADYFDYEDYMCEQPDLRMDIPRNHIRSVSFLDTLLSAPQQARDVSAAQDGSVLAWVIPAAGYQDMYELFIAGEGGVNGAQACRRLFCYYSNLEEVHFYGNFHTDDAADMQAMFWYCTSLTELDVECLNTSNVKNMVSMFGNCESLQHLDLSTFDTSSVENMGSMFYCCRNLTNLNLDSFDTSSVTNMQGMFWRCNSLTELNLSHFDTSSVNNMHTMFRECLSLQYLNVSSFDTSSVMDMSDMFGYCESLQSLDVSNFDTSSVTDMMWMFSHCESLQSLDVSNFDTSSVTDMNFMFSGCGSLTSLNLSGFDVSLVERHESFVEGVPAAAIIGNPWA